MFKLVIQDDEGKTTVVPLIRDEITIGRKEGNTIRLTERNVSRRHARIVRANGAVAIEDLGSYNGVRVNGTRIAQRTSLSVSDRVQIGDYLIELKAEGVEPVADDGKTQPIERMDPNFVEAQLAVAATMPPSPAPPIPTSAPPPHAAVGLAETDPAARPLPAIAVAPIGQSSGHARIVVLSSNFAGQEWELAKPQMIIGRTDDNDLVVNHRSISRNHAKFVREPDTGRYTISDLQSSNGVRVNGEEYGKVELRRGDVIDLGHVRLRFIEPGEDFLFGRDAQIADVPTGGKGKGLMIAAAVVLLGVGAVAVVMLTRSGDRATDQGAGSDRGSDDGSAVIAAAPVDARPIAFTTPDAAVASPTGDVVAKLAECRRHRDAEDWINVQSCAKALPPGTPDAEGLIDQAQREARAMLQLDTLTTTARQKDHQGTIEAMKKIPADSIYHVRATKIHDKLRDEYVADERIKAKLAADRHNCKYGDTRVQQITKSNLWKEAADAVAAVPCETKVAVAPTPECRKDSDCGGGKSCKADKCVVDKVDPQPSCDAAALLQEAKDAGGANQWSKMFTKAEAANKCSSSKTARQLALLAACQLGNRDKALKYWKEFENNAGMQQRCISIMK